MLKRENDLLGELISLADTGLIIYVRLLADGHVFRGQIIPSVLYFYRLHQRLCKEASEETIGQVDELTQSWMKYGQNDGKYICLSPSGTNYSSANDIQDFVNDCRVRLSAISGYTVENITGFLSTASFDAPVS